MELHEFLLARIAEDEERARDAALTVGWDGFGDQRIRSGQHWVPSYHVVKRARDDGPADRREVAECAPLFGKGPANHIARWDPARVLAECEARRRIVTECGWETVMRHLALPYADHPDYRDEWRP
jgi:hypothetical protein